MHETESMIASVRIAWSQIPAPPAEDLKYMAWACGEDAWRTFVAVEPVAVDISSPGFLGCTPLLELPNRAAAAYLGTYLLSLFDGLKFQETIGVFQDILTRAHVLYCLSDPDFWDKVICSHLPPECRRVLVTACAYLADRRDLLGLPQEQIDRMVRLSKKCVSSRN